jgi:Icc-related predicted phosphoesterase
MISMDKSDESEKEPISDENKILQIARKINSGEGLNEEEVDILTNSNLISESEKKNIENQIKANKLQNKLISGEQLSDEEKTKLDKDLVKRQFSDDTHSNFMKIAESSKNQKGKKVIHFTDPHLKIDDLEERLKQVLLLNEFNPQEDIFVNTGDIIPDLMDREHGFNVLNPKRIALEGKLNDTETSEFIEDMDEFMSFFGFTSQAVENSFANFGGNAEQLYQNFYQNFLKMTEPQYLSEDELIRFREVRDRVHKNFRKAIRRHAREAYEKIRAQFEKYNLNPENTILTPGNHDVEEVMNEILGAYIIKPGEIRNLKGTKIGNLISGSTGEILGPELSNEYALRDVARNPQTMYNTNSFKALYNRIKEIGIKTIDKFSLANRIASAREKAQIGISNSALSKYFEAKIRPEIDHTVNTVAASFPKLKPSDVDLFVGHGDPSGQFASAEERRIHDYLMSSDEKRPYLHGHLHDNTSHTEGNVHYLNPGSVKSLNHAVYLLDPNNSINNILFAGLNPLTSRPEYRVTNLENLLQKGENRQRAA